MERDVAGLSDPQGDTQQALGPVEIQDSQQILGHLRLQGARCPLVVIPAKAQWCPGFERSLSLTVVIAGLDP